MFIPDEYEVEYATNYSGSYDDDIMSGSMFAAGGRTREGSHVSGSNWIFQMATSQTTVPFSAFYNRQQKFNIGLNYKYNISNCPSELYADSVLPDMMEVAIINGGKRVFQDVPEGQPAGPWYPPSGAFYNIKIVLGYSDLFITGISGGIKGQQVSDNTWLQTFPFQYSYQTATRRPGLQSIAVSTDYNESALSAIAQNNHDVIYSYAFFAPLSDPAQFALEFLVPGSSSFATLSGPPASNSPGDWSNIQHRTLTEFYGQITQSSLQLNTTSSFEYSQPTNIHKHFFGFGDGFRGQVLFQRISASAESDAVPSYLHGQGAIVRGWKYGAINGVPLVTSMVWRRGKFGQLRDILEQRKYTKFYDAIGINANGAVGGKVGLTDSFIRIVFVSGSAAYVTASLSASLNTRESGIYDFEYKSNIPFFDNITTRF